MPEPTTYNQDTEIDDQVDEEEQIAAELALEQDIYQSEQELNRLQEEGGSYRSPSWLKYGLLFFLAAIVDIVDLSDLTGIGAIVGRAVSFLFSVVIILILWFTDTKQKNAQEYVENLPKSISYIASEIDSAIVRSGRLGTTAGRFAARMLRRSARGSALRMGTARLLRASRRITAVGRKNPIARFAFMALANLVPFLAVIPFMTLGIYLSYRAEKTSYDNAREAAEAINPEEVLGEAAA